MTVAKFQSADAIRKEEIQALLIQDIEALLAQVRAGQVVAVGYAFVDREGAIGNGFEGCDMTRLGFSIRVMEARFVNGAMIELEMDEQ